MLPDGTWTVTRPYVSWVETLLVASESVPLRYAPGSTISRMVPAPEIPPGLSTLRPPDPCGLAIVVLAIEGDGVSTRGCCRRGLRGERSVAHRAVKVGDEAPRVRSENPVQGFRAVLGNVDADLQIPIGVVT